MKIHTWTNPPLAFDFEPLLYAYSLIENAFYMGINCVGHHKCVKVKSMGSGVSLSPYGVVETQNVCSLWGWLFHKGPNPPARTLQWPIVAFPQI